MNELEKLIQCIVEKTLNAEEAFIHITREEATDILFEFKNIKTLINNMLINAVDEDDK